MPRYSDILMQHFSAPRNVGRIVSPDALGETGSPQHPPFMVMSFRIEGSVIREIKYQTFGCGPAIAAGSLLTEMAKGRTVEEGLAITPTQLAESLGGFPKDKMWIAELAINTLRNGLERYLAAGESGAGSE